ncbi:clumping factor A-like [Zerene cesonia]|uniref:clumping factor A-like n=1 Tax=Zerene cesonia TaxID=33412 RepID=UPI0018E54B2A|nr:clumping factor A-like [Zerene cesonia]
MVDIRDDITSSFELEDYVHWDSDNGTDSDPDIYVEKRRKVGSLTSLTLKTIFSDKFLGKVPKKKRKIKMENAFDSMLNASEVDNDFRLDIDSIIQNLGEDDKSERDSVSIKILNVFSQKEMDYDSDRTSFNDEFDTVQSKDTNQTTNFSNLIKSNLSTDINDETSTNSIDSSIGETSILQNVKEMLDRNELKTLLDTDVKESNLEDNKNDNVSDSDLNGVTNERNDKKLENEPTNTVLSVENEKSGNLNEPKNEFEKMNSDNSNHRNHDSEDAVLRLNSDEKCAEINYSSKNNHTLIDEQEQKENDISNGDTAKASIDKDDVKVSDSNSDKDALKEKEENAISMSKGVSEETKNDPSKNNTENGIGSNGIIEIANSTEALSVESAKSCSKNTNLDENSEKSEHSISEKSNLEANNVKIDNVGNKECSEVMNSVGNIDNTSKYVENVSANDDIEKSDRDLLNNTKNNSDNSNRNETTTPEINEIHELEYTNSDVHFDRNVSVNTVTTDDTSVNAKQKDYIDIGKNAENTQEINRDAIKQSDSDKNGGIDSDNFNMDDLEDVSDTDIDDSELMSDINEQLNERNDKNDKITLDDLLAKGQTDLDSISDGEFALDE